jgi:hypothetical protein
MAMGEDIRKLSVLCTIELAYRQEPNQTEADTHTERDFYPARYLLLSVATQARLSLGKHFGGPGSLLGVAQSQSFVCAAIRNLTGH